MQWEEKVAIMMCELGKEAKIKDMWRMSVNDEDLRKRQKSQGEGGVSHGHSDSAISRWTERDVRAEVDISGLYDGIQEDRRATIADGGTLARKGKGKEDGTDGSKGQLKAKERRWRRNQVGAWGTQNLGISGTVLDMCEVGHKLSKW